MATPTKRKPGKSAKGDEDLPPEWKKMYSDRKQRYYYFNEVTRTSSWKPPTQDDVPCKTKQKKKVKKKKKSKDRNSSPETKDCSTLKEKHTKETKSDMATPRLLPKVKKCSDLCKTLKTDPVFSRGVEQLITEGGNTLEHSDSDEQVCILHKDSYCSKQKKPPDSCVKIIPKKPTNKRRAVETVDVDGDTKATENRTQTKRQRLVPKPCNDLEVSQEVKVAARSNRRSLPTEFEPILQGLKQKSENVGTSQSRNVSTSELQSASPTPKFSGSYSRGRGKRRSCGTIPTVGSGNITPGKSSRGSLQNVGVKSDVSTATGKNQPSWMAEVNKVGETVETSGRKLLQRRRSLEAEKVRKTQDLSTNTSVTSLTEKRKDSGANSNTNNSSESRKPQSVPIKKGGIGAGCQSKAVIATRTSPPPEASELPSYEEVLSTQGRRLVSPKPPKITTGSSPLMRIYNTSRTDTEQCSGTYSFERSTTSSRPRDNASDSHGKAMTNSKPERQYSVYNTSRTDTEQCSGTYSLERSTTSYRPQNNASGSHGKTTTKSQPEKQYSVVSNVKSDSSGKLPQSKPTGATVRLPGQSPIDFEARSSVQTKNLSDFNPGRDAKQASDFQALSNFTFKQSAVKRNIDASNFAKMNAAAGSNCRNDSVDSSGILGSCRTNTSVGAKTSVFSTFSFKESSITQNKDLSVSGQISANSARNNGTESGFHQGSLRTFTGSSVLLNKDISNFGANSSGINSQVVTGSFPVSNAVEEAMEVEMSTLPQADRSSDKQIQTLYVVVDTNILIYEVDFILELKDQNLTGLGRPYIVIPWVVLQELDSVKMGRSQNYVIVTLADFLDTRFVFLNYMCILQVADTRNRARTAVNILNTLLESKHPRFVGQTAKQNCEKLPWFPASSNDDRILQCCLQFEQMYGIGSTVLLSHDTHLRSKALVSGVQSYSKQTFTKWVSEHDSSKKPSSPGTVPVQSRLNCSTSATVSVNSFSAQNAATIGVTSTIANASYNKKLTEEEPYTKKDLVDEVFCEVKVLLRDAFSPILQKEMQEVYCELWEGIVYRKPPWTLMDVLMSINKHWIAVFGQKLQRDSKDTIEGLMSHFKMTTYGQDLKNCVEMVTLSRSLCENFASLPSYKDVLSDVNVKLERLQKIVSRVMSGVVKVKKLEVLKTQDLRPGLSTDAPMQPASESQVSTATADSSRPPTPLSMATSVIDSDSGVKQCFQMVWEAIHYFSGVTSERLSASPQNAERVEVLDFLCKLCANVAALHTVYAKITRESNSADLVFEKLVQVLHRFTAEFNVQNMMIPLTDKLKLFFTNISNRDTVEFGLAQLEQMMQSMAGVQNVLTRDELVTIETYSQKQSTDMGIT